MFIFDFDDEDSAFAIRCNGKPYIDISEDDLGQDGKEELLRLLKRVSDDYDAEESLFDLIFEPYIPLLRLARW